LSEQEVQKVDERIVNWVIDQREICRNAEKAQKAARNEIFQLSS
jgi:hypothetical protein